MNDDIISRLQEVPGGVAEDAIVEITNLKAENARLRAVLRLAIETVEFWAAYASPYIQDKFDRDEVKRLAAEAEKAICFEDARP
jgi:hypothetical protein